MLRFAHARRHVTAALADAAALPFAEGTADAVLLAYVLFMRWIRPAVCARLRAPAPRRPVGTVTWGSEEQSLAAKTWDRP